MGNFKKVENYLKSREAVLLNLALLSHALCIIYFHSSLMCLVLSLSILIIYFLLSKRKDKKKIVFTMMHFSFWGTLMESYIISRCNKKCLSYDCNGTGLNIPYWLFITYQFFVLGVLHFYKICSLYFD